MFGVTGAGLSGIRHYAGGGKKHRWSLDTWDRVCSPLFSWILVLELTCFS